MRILFTKSKSLLSYLICAVTKEPVSHCALEIHGWVIHSNLYGVHAEPLEDFRGEIVYSVEVPYKEEALISGMAKYQGRMYDVGALLYLGLKYLLPFLPKKNLWQSSSMFLCTEWVTQVLDGRADSMVTPYKLYERLVK